MSLTNTPADRTPACDRYFSIARSKPVAVVGFRFGLPCVTLPLLSMTVVAVICSKPGRASVEEIAKRPIRSGSNS